MIAGVMQGRLFDDTGGQTLVQVAWRGGGVSIHGAVRSMAGHQPGQLGETEAGPASSSWLHPDGLLRYLPSEAVLLLRDVV